VAAAQTAKGTKGFADIRHNTEVLNEEIKETPASRDGPDSFFKFSKQ
jgi:hypothetical protein